MVQHKGNTPEERFIYFIEYLKSSGKVRFKEQIYSSIKIRRQEVDYIKKGNRRVTSDIIQNLCKSYNVNANWLFGTEKEMFRK